MNVLLNDDQRAQLELISLHAGKPPSQVLTETALYLLDYDIRFWKSVQRGVPPTGTLHPAEADILEEEALDARLATVLGR